MVHGHCGREVDLYREFEGDGPGDVVDGVVGGDGVVTARCQGHGTVR